MTKILMPTRFGNPILRKVATPLSIGDISSPDIQELIADMRYTLKEEDYGVGIAAPQVGKSLALSVLGIKPTPSRPDLATFEAIIINPQIVKTYGDPVPMWEACISCGQGENILDAQVPRYESIKLRWLDETGTPKEEELTGFVAHVAQHETDHLEGVLFVDRVVDTSSFMMADEYRKRVGKN
jgi:peptide deformylase